MTRASNSLLCQSQAPYGRRRHRTHVGSRAEIPATPGACRRRSNGWPTASCRLPYDSSTADRIESWSPGWSNSRSGASASTSPLGYLEQYQRLVDKSAAGTLTTAELVYLVQNFDAAELYRYEQERELSIALLEDWLVRYKFKNWRQTETRKIKVTKKMRSERAREVAEMLNKTDRWHSHSRGIPMEVLRRDLNLLIDDFDSDATLGPAVHDYYRLLKDYAIRRSHYTFVLHGRGRYVGFGF